MLPVGSMLGELQMSAVLCRYDSRPILFVCTDTGGRSYVADFVDETAESDTFLYAELRPEHCDTADLVDLGAVYRDPPGGVVFEVTFSVDDPDGSVVRRAVSSISDDWFPGPDTWVHLSKEAS